MNPTNLIKTLILVGLSSSLTAFAGPKDLKIFNTLAKVGVGFENEMSHTWVGVDSISCEYGFESKQTSCTMTDTSGNDGAGSELALTGRNARRIFKMLEKLNAPAEAGMGHYYISAQSINCSQAAEGVADGTLSERTNCNIDLIETEEN